MLGAPLGGVGGVDGDHGHTEFGGHGYQPGSQPGHRHAGDQLAEPLVPTVLLAGLRGLEVEIFDCDREAVPGREVKQPDQGVP
ncbi:hypothetical protein GCM10010324_31070 [Streptomyces hiroshimensis]|uniref:Uncharacterized protein n=1 Tax=Streptomyces hiroshimensis TaxID=66424 RepID=A0ABQ2YGV9_9ACTN|nr:hypothetical protein GCM10010324_31070 [Streptomyces hiroshimensis]